MITRYTLVASLTVAASSLMLLSPASALEIAQAQQAQPTQTQPDAGGTSAPISEQKIEAFAVAYLQVDKVRQEYSTKIGATTDELRRQSCRTKPARKWSGGRDRAEHVGGGIYEILKAAQSDPALAQKVQEKLQTSTPQQPQQQ